MRVYKRGDIWWAVFYDRSGERHRVSTKCHDRQAAETIAKQLERDFADPEATIARQATLSQALRMLVEKRLEQARMGKRSPATAEMYRKKSGHLVRLLEHVGGVYAPMPLVKLTATHVDRYIATRTEEGAAGNTITKELVTLRASLKVAARAGLWNGSLLTLMPAESVSDYKPRTRWLPEAEVNQLLAQLRPDRAARVGATPRATTSPCGAARARTITRFRRSWWSCAPPSSSPSMRGPSSEISRRSERGIRPTTSLDGPT